MNSIFQMPLILDGAMGTTLISRGIKTPLPLWSAIANHENFDDVVSVHEEYIKNGSDVITTNTFRTTQRTYKKAGFNTSEAKIKSKQSLELAVEAANIAKKEKGILIAGSIAPLEDCYEPGAFPGVNIAEYEYGHLIDIFNDQIVDILLFETMGNFKEINTLLRLNISSSKKTWLSIVLKNENQLLDGTDIIKIIELAYKYSVDTLLVNCTTINTTLRAIPIIKNYWKGKWGIYPNLGKSMPTKTGYINAKINDIDISMQLLLAVKEGSSVIGACCGSSPDTISQIIKNLINNSDR